MELADDIAYGVHDLEDAIVLGMVTRTQWQEAAAAQLAECGDPGLKNILPSSVRCCFLVNTMCAKMRLAAL